ncbi:hypothetical protein ANO11243_070040 [Dothideomycetidae sp. 11243]|nr:hypothetical protein ANO11243_070040 [fungal sp. No.11243]
MPPKRMTANPLAPLRYRAGKAPSAADEPSDSESESESDSDASPPPKQKRAAPPKAASFPKLGGDLASRQAAAAKSRAAEEAARRAAEEEGFETASDSSGDESGSDNDDDESESGSESDYESDSSTGRPRFAAPTFVRKAARDAAKPPDTNSTQASRDDEAARKEKADAMLQAQIEREAAERAAGRRDWDDEDALLIDDVDDTDGLDPAAEHAAWRLRELKRVQRERAALEAVEAEKEEVERRRNLTAEERRLEDEEYIAKQREEQGAKGKMGFMQKYFHKGAFFQEEGGEEISEDVRAAMSRDVNAARFQDDAVNRELLPQYMQIRDMTRLGKKGRTRYKDLKSEDTGSFGVDLGGRSSKGEAGGRYRESDGPSGANQVTVGERRRRDEDGGREEKRPRYDR